MLCATGYYDTSAPAQEEDQATAQACVLVWGVVGVGAGLETHHSTAGILVYS